MSGICDTCRRTTCEYRADDIAICGLPKTETNWERLFGTPERTAQTIIKTCNETAKCEACPIFYADINALNINCSDYDELLEWLRGDS